MRDADWDEVVNALEERTKQGRLAWKEAGARDAFSCSLGAFMFDVRRLEADDHTVVQLAIQESGQEAGGHTLWEIRARSSVSSVRPAAQGSLFHRLCGLLEVARQQALDLDAKLALLRETLANA